MLRRDSGLRLECQIPADGQERRKAEYQSRSSTSQLARFDSNSLNLNPDFSNLDLFGPVMNFLETIEEDLFAFPPGLYLKSKAYYFFLTSENLRFLWIASSRPGKV